MPFRRALVGVLLTGAIFAATVRSKDSKKIPELSNPTVRSWMRTMSLHDKVAQLVVMPVLGEPANVRSAAFRRYLHYIRDLHVGGLIVTGNAQNGSVRNAEPYAMAALLNPTSSFPSLHVPLSLLVGVVCFFFGGYFMYSAMFAAIGSACSSEQDAHQLQWLAMTPLVFTMVIYSVVLNDPTSKAAVVLSEIPLFAPVLMPLRMSLQMPPVPQIILSLVLLLGAILGAIWASAKVYRVGVLMYGKRPTLPELLRWLRYS